MINIAIGYLDVVVHDQDRNPVPNATVHIYRLESDQMLYDAVYQTDARGICEHISLIAPEQELSKHHEYIGEVYGTYQVEISKENYDIEERRGIQIFAGQGSSMNVELQLTSQATRQRNILVIPEHSLLQRLEDHYA